MAPQAFSGALREFQPDLIHAHYATKPTAEARGWPPRSMCRSLSRLTASTFTTGRRATLPSEHAAAAAVITVSEANARHIATSFGVPRERIRVIPCGVDTALFCPAEGRTDAAAGDLDGAAEPPGPIVCVARHWPVKNLGLLLEACAILRDRGVKFRCVMIGDGPSHDELAGIRAQLDLEPLVEMIGEAERATVLAWLRRASVAVLSSHSEGMPVSLMEAGACEVPVVATRVGGIPELVEDGVTGILTPPGDAPAMADAFERLLSNPRRRAEMGRAARRRIEANFSHRRTGRSPAQLVVGPGDQRGQRPRRIVMALAIRSHRAHFQADRSR